MKALPIIIFLLSVNLLSVAAAEYVTEEFKFEQTITIYHMINDSGIIYLRPDKYDENQGFIKIFEAMDQYLTELQQSELNSRPTITLSESIATKLLHRK